MRRIQILILCVAVSFAVSGARAQDQQGGATQPGAPTPPLPADNSGNSGGHELLAPAGRALSIYGPDSTDQTQPDDHALLGGEIIGLGSLSGSATVFDPAFRFSESVDNGIVQGHYDSVSSIGGSLGVDHKWDRYHFTVAYSGAMTFYAPDSSNSEPYHNFGISQTIQLRKWVIRLSDNLNVSPQANFGGLYAGSTGLLGQSASLTGLSPTFALGETVLTGQVNQANNISFAEIDLLVSRRTTIAFTGSYGILHYFSTGYIDDRQSNGGISYNYALSSKNTLALSYGFNHINYTGAGTGATQTQSIQVGFGRKITGRLGFQLSGGPQYVQLLGTGMPGGQYWTWTVSTSLNYALTRATTFNLSYYHYATNGSGVFLGSEDDTINAGVNHRFTRTLSMSVNAGYAYTNNLVLSGTTANHYGNFYIGTNLSRQIGREISLSGSYAFQQQNDGFGTCPVVSCGFLAGTNREVAGVTVEWHPWAIVQQTPTR